MKEYQFLDSGNGQLLERFGDYTLIRPCMAAIWKPKLSSAMWQLADAVFTRLPSQKWDLKNNLPDSWEVIIKGIKFKIERTSFGHLGLFPEHSTLWDWLDLHISPKMDVLNLFGYTGAASLFAASKQANVCHVDASKAVVDKARENALLNELDQAPIRWIVDDVFKFLKREIKRERKYGGIILDPPSFGRGSKGEVFKIERDLIELLGNIRKLLSEDAKFILLTCHTPGITPMSLHNIMSQVFAKGSGEVGELTLSTEKHQLPKGIYAKWTFR